MLCRYRRTSQNPLDDCERNIKWTQKKEEACTLAIKTVKRYQKLHYNTNQDFFFSKKKAKGSNVYPNTDDLN